MDLHDSDVATWVVNALAGVGLFVVLVMLGMLMREWLWPTPPPKPRKWKMQLTDPTGYVYGVAVLDPKEVHRVKAMINHEYDPNTEQS